MEKRWYESTTEETYDEFSSTDPRGEESEEYLMRDSRFIAVLGGDLSRLMTILLLLIKSRQRSVTCSPLSLRIYYLIMR